MTTNRSFAALLGAALLAGCGDSGVQDITAPAPASAVKFFNFGVNAPAVNFYANDAKLTAISTASCTPPTDPACLSKGIESTTGTASGAAAAGGLYVGVAPGPYTLSGRITAATDNGLTVATAPATIESGKRYSFFISGIYDAAGKKADSFIIEDPIPATIDPARSYVRFVNAIPNAPALTIVLRDPTTGIETAPTQAVPYKGATTFGSFGGGIVDLIVRTSGSSAATITRTNVGFSPNRVYTITARGDFTVTSTTAATRPQLDVTANR